MFKRNAFLLAVSLILLVTLAVGGIVQAQDGNEVEAPPLPPPATPVTAPETIMDDEIQPGDARAEAKVVELGDATPAPNGDTPPSRDVTLDTVKLLDGGLARVEAGEPPMPGQLRSVGPKIDPGTSPPGRQ